MLKKLLIPTKKACQSVNQAEKKQRTHSFMYIFRSSHCLIIKNLSCLNKHVAQPEILG